MGTGWNLLAVSPPADAGAGIQAALDRIVAQMSQWEPESDISRFNRAAPGRWHLLPPEFVTVLQAALDVALASGGAFDPALGALTDLWGFGPAPAPVAAPGEDVIAGLLADRGTVELDARGLRARRNGGARLDFSGIAKGFGVDQAAEWLLARGARHFLVEVGGELRGEGLKPDGQPWWVDIEIPPGMTIAPLRIALHGLAIATTGDYRRWLDAGGRRHGHTLDPRSGRPVHSGVRSVTVLHADCMLADAWATALAVLGPGEGLELAERHGLAAHMIAGDAEHMSPVFAAMLD
jgi:thiamine biosynthesis lipoprotein